MKYLSALYHYNMQGINMHINEKIFQQPFNVSIAVYVCVRLLFVLLLSLDQKTLYIGCFILLLLLILFSAFIHISTSVLSDAHATTLVVGVLQKKISTSNKIELERTHTYINRTISRSNQPARAMHIQLYFMPFDLLNLICKCINSYRAI